eukprot:EG_transcript_27419
MPSRSPPSPAGWVGLLGLLGLLVYSASFAYDVYLSANTSPVATRPPPLTVFSAETLRSRRPPGSLATTPPLAPGALLGAEGVAGHPHLALALGGTVASLALAALTALLATRPRAAALESRWQLMGVAASQEAAEVVAAPEEEEEEEAFDLVTFYESWSGDYAQLLDEVDWRVPEWLSEQGPHFRAGQQVLDLGCADGTVGDLVNCLQPGVRFTGVDVAPTMVENCR